MNETLKSGIFLFLRVLVVDIMCIIVTVSVGVLAMAVFTENIGYTAYVTDKDGKEIAEYHFNLADGEDSLYNDYTSQGYNVKKVTERSQLKGKGYILSNVISQTISLIMLFVFVHNSMFTIGNRDGNLVKFNHKSEDKLWGFKAGLIAMIPFVVLFLACIVFALGLNKDMTVSLFTLPMFYVFQILRVIIGDITTLGALSVWQFVLMFALLFVVPLFSFAAYLLGYKDILIFEKLTYKKKK